jgi:ABC-type bacteriocin/lantibiotic exporter with double-glycine peptidase domain
LLVVGTALGVISVALELAAMSSLFPLAIVAAGRSVPNDTLLVRSLGSIGLPMDGRTLLLAFVLLFTLRVVTQLASQALAAYVSRRLLAQLATRAFAALLKQVPLREVERESIGSFITLAGDESFRASNIVLHLNQLVALALLAVLYYAAIWLYSPGTAVAVVVFLAFSFAALFESFRVSHRLGARQVEQSQAAGSLFLDALNGLRSVRAFSAEDYVATSYRSQMSAYMRTLFLIDAVSLLTRLGPALILLAAVAVVAVWPTLGERFSLDLPLIATLIVFLMRFFPVIGQALNVVLRLIADTRAARDVTRLLREYPGKQEPGSFPAIHGIERIEAKRITFKHSADRPLLEGFEFALVRGTSYALVGLSGSGKSTLLDLLLGFYSVEEGTLAVNGVPVGQADLRQLRGRVLLVSQESAIFNDTVANNLRFGKDASAEEIERAARVACIHEFITTLPNGYDTVLAYRGTNLSGGQRQRIGIARAILRRPDVLLLDESTSALDAETRGRVVDNLLDEFRERIILFVTHDSFVVSRVSNVLQMPMLVPPAGAADDRATEPAVTRYQVQ